MLLIGYFLLPAPPAPADNPLLPVNVNYVYGLDDKPQTWMHPHLYVLLVLTVLPVAVYAPTHFVLRLLFPRLQSSHEANVPGGLPLPDAGPGRR